MSTRKTQKTGKRRKTIGQNPLDSLLGVPVPKGTRKRRTAVTAEEATNESASHGFPNELTTPPTKVRATFHIPADLLDECRNAVVHLSGPPERLTMARLAEDALRRELDRLRKLHTNGAPFPPRDDDLRGGRPIGS